jgi:hypothetical protein
LRFIFESATQSAASWWVGVNRNATNVQALQSVHGGYIYANSDNETVSETTGSATPTWPSGLTANSIFNWTAQDPPAIRNLKKITKDNLPFAKKLKLLVDLGFNNLDRNIDALVETKGDIRKSIKYLASTSSF